MASWSEGDRAVGIEQAVRELTEPDNDKALAKSAMIALNSAAVGRAHASGELESIFVRQVLPSVDEVRTRSIFSVRDAHGVVIEEYPIDFVSRR